MIATRERLPRERPGRTVHVYIEGGEGGRLDFYLSSGEYEDGRLGEVFVKGAGKEGSHVQGLLDGWATMVSIAIQSGFGVDEVVEKFRGRRFEPAGTTRDPEIPRAASMLDYVATWVGLHYGSEVLRGRIRAEIEAEG